MNSRVNFQRIKKHVLTAAVAGASLFAMQSANAANWMQLYGTTPRPGQSPHAKVWGFIQPLYSVTDGKKMTGLLGPVAGFNDTTAAFNRIGPDLNSTNSFNLFRARIGVRGTLTPLDNDLDYFILTEWGNNGQTYFNNQTPSVTDAFVTWNRFKKVARISFGAQKTPGPLEASQVGIPVLPFVNFTTATQQLILEKYIDPKATLGGSAAAGYTFSKTDVTGMNAFRDTGLKVFNWFDFGPWELSYSVMAGNGAPITKGNTTNSVDTYAMVKGAYILSGAGPYRNEASLWTWFHQGERKLSNLSDSNYNMARFGVGGEFSRNQRRPMGFFVQGGYMGGYGMIMTGSPFADASCTSGAGAGCWKIYPDSYNRAWGDYLQGGFYVTHNVQLQLRYDYYDSLTNNKAAERTFTTWTVGGQYFLSNNTRFTVNYAIRDMKVPNASEIPAGPARTNAEAVADSMGNRLDLQLTAVF
ncbi:MAG: hypothetical protein P8Y64_10445 [Gammaproteobacteria bacterium]|jgi:hypothetical protein